MALPRLTFNRLCTQRILARRLSTSSAGKEAFLSRGTGENEGITFLTLDRASAKNALSVKLLDEMHDAVEEVRFDTATRALIVQSSTPGTFCAGADLKERRSMNATEVARFLYRLRQTFSALEDLPMPSFAAIDGPALGGGLELALCCDLRVASESVDKIGLVETRLGIIPGAGGTQRATRLLGPARAKELIFTAKVLNAKQAAAIGLVNHLASTNQTAADKAKELAREILPNGPLAVRAAKLAIDTGIQLDLESGLDFEQQCYRTILTTQDRLEGLKAFAEKRKPQYKGE